MCLLSSQALVSSGEVVGLFEGDVGLIHLDPLAAFLVEGHGRVKEGHLLQAVSEASSLFE